MNNPYVTFTVEALAYIEKNAHNEDTINIRKGLRSVAQFLETIVGREYKPARYAVYLHNTPPEYFALESDAKKKAEFCGGEVRAV